MWENLAYLCPSLELCNFPRQAQGILSFLSLLLGNRPLDKGQRVDHEALQRFKWVEGSGPIASVVLFILILHLRKLRPKEGGWLVKDLQAKLWKIQDWHSQARALFTLPHCLAYMWKTQETPEILFRCWILNCKCRFHLSSYRLKIIQS